VKLHLQQAAAQNLFTGYGKDFVTVNQRNIETNVVVLPDSIIEPWNVISFESLSEADFVELASLKVEIILLGTGPSIRFPHPKLSEPLRKVNVGFEVMDTQAACRTYNILLGEGRQIAAALFIK
jgi:uncharacterized protein